MTETELEVHDAQVVDAYIGRLSWEPETPDEVRTLVAGNIRGFAAYLRERERNRLADLVRDLVFTQNFPGWRMGCAIAERAVRRGRHLTPKEQVDNLLAAMAEDDPEGARQLVERAVAGELDA